MPATATPSALQVSYPDANMTTMVTLSFAVGECTGSGKACQKKSRRQLQHNGSQKGINHDDDTGGAVFNFNDDDNDGVRVKVSTPWNKEMSNRVQSNL